MTGNPLDRPVWASLTTFHETLSQGDGAARRYLADVNLFASTRRDNTGDLAALEQLVGPGDVIYILQVPRISVPPGLVVEHSAVGVQMVASRPIGDDDEHRDVAALGDEDAAEMQALATLTKPGPFLSRTNAMGEFVGIKIDGRLVAMAGERMRFPGFTEVSGVCVHPDFRGLGFARRLSKFVAAKIEARGDKPFLHAWKSNTAAISLYQSLGFRHRADVNVAVLTKHVARR